MQGTMVVLMALSGLGCHHKRCDVGYAPAPACYASCNGMVMASMQGSPAMYSGCYSSYSADVGYVDYGSTGCYGGGYASACYGGCYDGHSACHGGGLFRKHRARKMFGLCGHHRRNCGCNACAPVASTCYEPVYGSYTPVVMGNPIYGSGQTPSGQAWTSSQGYGGSMGGMMNPRTPTTTVRPDTTDVVPPPPPGVTPGDSKTVTPPPEPAPGADKPTTEPAPAPGGTTTTTTTTTEKP